MRRTLSLFAVLALLACVTPARAQSPVKVVPAVLVEPIPTPTSTVEQPTASDIVSRLHSFDRNGDTRIARDELPERMHGVLQRHDEDRDGALSASEVVSAVRGASRGGAVSRSFRSKPTTLADVVKDLRLPQPKHDQATEFARKYKVSPNFITGIETELDLRMRDLLDDEEYESFVAAAARLRGAQTLRLSVTPTPAVVTAPPGR